MITDYGMHAYVENLVGETKHERPCLDQVKNNYAFFQIVMPPYIMWHCMKMTAPGRMSE